jgi:hypothetical protein
MTLQDRSTFLPWYWVRCFVLKCWALITQWHLIISQRNGNLMLAFFVIGRQEGHKRLPRAPPRCMFFVFKFGENPGNPHTLYSWQTGDVLVSDGWCTCSGNWKLLESGEQQLRGPSYYNSGLLHDLWLKKINLTNCNGYIHWMILQCATINGKFTEYCFSDVRTV